MKKNSVLLSIIGGTVLLFVAAILIYSCSSGSSGVGTINGGNGGGGSASGTVSLYATDDISNHKQVIATIDQVTIISTGSGTSCDLLTTATTATVNIANLASILQLLNVSSCPSVTYDKISIEFNKSVELMNAEGIQSACSFTSYLDDSDRPNPLQCNGDLCTVVINSPVNILVNQNNQVALDFNLKAFDVDNFGTPQCTVQMKVSPICGDGFRNLGYRQSITGVVSALTTSTQTFDLTKHDRSFTVLYSNITTTQQPGLDDLLLRAQQDALNTRVTASTFDFIHQTIVASNILVKTEGLVSALSSSTTTTFTLTYDTGKTMTVDISKSVVKGTLANNASVEVKLYGFDSTTSDFLAADVEVEYACTVPDDDRPRFDTDD